MTAAYPLLIPFQHRLHLGLFQKLSIRLMQRRPTPPSCPHVHVKKLAEVMAQTGEEAEALRLQRVRCGLENSRDWKDISEKCLFKLLQHLQSDFERVLQEPEAAAVVMVGAGRQVADQ